MGHDISEELKILSRDRFVKYDALTYTLKLLLRRSVFSLSVSQRGSLAATLPKRLLNAKMIIMLSSAQGIASRMAFEYYYSICMGLRRYKVLYPKSSAGMLQGYPDKRHLALSFLKFRNRIA